jgi:hypothetical protein
MPTHLESPDASRYRRLGGVLLLMSGAASLCVVIGGAIAWTQYQRTATYRPTTATIQFTGIRESHHPTRARAGSSAPITRTYTPVIAFLYTVAAVTYTSDRVMPIARAKSERWARAFIAAYRPGEAVTAYYDPANPASAVLVRDRGVVPYLFVAIGLGLFAGVARLYRLVPEEVRGR